MRTAWRTHSHDHGQHAGHRASTSETCCGLAAEFGPRSRRTVLYFGVTWACTSSRSRLPSRRSALDQFSGFDCRVHAFPLPSSADTIRSLGFQKSLLPAGRPAITSNWHCRDQPSTRAGRLCTQAAPASLSPARSCAQRSQFALGGPPQRRQRRFQTRAGCVRQAGAEFRHVTTIAAA